MNKKLIYAIAAILIISASGVALYLLKFSASAKYTEAQSILSSTGQTPDGDSIRKYISLLESAANSGHPEAQLAIGNAYGFGIPGSNFKTDSTKAKKWLQSAISTNPKSNKPELSLAALYANEGTSEGSQKAFNIYEKVGKALIDSNNASLQELITVFDPLFNIFANSGVGDKDKITKYLAILAEQGDPKSQAYMGVILAKGKYDLSDNKPALTWYELAYKSRDPLAALMLGHHESSLYEKSKDIKHLNLSLDYFRIARLAKSNQPRNAYYTNNAISGARNLLLNLRQLHLVKPNDKKITEDIEEEVNSIFDFYLNITPKTESDFSIAITQWAGATIYRGNSSEIFPNTSMRPNFEKAFKLASLAAMVDPGSEYLLGQLYFDGIGTPVDKQKGHQTFEKCATKLSQCQLWVGMDYWRGEGVAYDGVKAKEWIVRAAGNGNRRAMILLAKRLLSNDPMPFSEARDVDAAQYWIEKSLENAADDTDPESTSVAKSLLESISKEANAKKK